MNRSLVIIASVWPEPNSTAAGKRILQLIELFQDNNFDIHFLSTAKFSEYAFPLENISVHKTSILLNHSSFEKDIKKINPSVVLYDRFIIEEQFGWRIKEICPNAVCILDTEDLHFLRKARENAFKKNESMVYNHYLSDTFKREIASILRCDLTFIISGYELELLTETFKINKSLLHYIPITVKNVKKSEIPFSNRKNFISIGNFLHEPNWQTVLQLKKIWKDIKAKLPEANLYIYGAYLTEKAKQLHHEKEGFIIKGRAKSVQQVYNESRILLAPIPFGAGIKGKILESMELGLPNVTTTIGAEAMHGNLPWNGEIENNMEQFTKLAIDLYKEEKRWKIAQENGYTILNSLFLKEKHTTSFIYKINDLLTNLQQHRDANFLGQVLQHHTLQSTKYLGKWIEEKNKEK